MDKKIVLQEIKNKKTRIIATPDDGAKDAARKSLAVLLHKIQKCLDYNTLYAMEDDFNAVGLTIQSTVQNRMILCRIKDKQPSVGKVLEDYIFIGSLATRDNEVSSRALEIITSFIQNNASVASKVENIARIWRNGVRVYGQVIPIINEDIAFLSQAL